MNVGAVEPSQNEGALAQLRRAGFDGTVTATGRYQEEEEAARNAGASTVYNSYAAAGAAYAAHVMEAQAPTG